MNILTLSHVKKSFADAKRSPKMPEGNLEGAEKSPMKKEPSGINEVLRDVSFSVPTHSVYGFVGLNGAGKTTTMKLILGLLKPDGGDIRVKEESVIYGENRTNRYIGYLPDVPEFYGFMTPAEYLAMCGEITGMRREEIKKKSAWLLELVGLENADKRIKGFSRGMKQRLGIAQALLNSPELLICDEPTSALDPIGRKEILEVLHAVKEQTTVLFSTHILSDVERICDRIAFLHDGTIALEGTLEEMRAKRKGGSVELQFMTADEAQRFLERFGSGIRQNGPKVLLENQTTENRRALLQCLADGDFDIERMERLEPTLEDLFMEVAGR